MRQVRARSTFISAGCNRVVNAAAWGPPDLVAFAVHNAVAIFSPQTAEIVQTLPGHKASVHCLEWVPKYKLEDSDFCILKEYHLISGSADGVMIIWAFNPSENKWRMVMQFPNSHGKAVSCIAGFMHAACEAIIASSSSDCTVCIWDGFLRSKSEGNCELRFKQSICTGPRPAIAVSLARLPASEYTFVLALGGLDNNIHLHCGTHDGQFVPACILKGHQDWIRSLEFSPPVFESEKQELFLASCGQDRNIRIWRINPRISSSQLGKEVASIKMYIEGPVFKFGSMLWQASMESLLVGHDDWVYSVKWQPPRNQVQEDAGQDGSRRLQKMSILSASMDRTMMIWHPEPCSGLWINDVTVGELGHTALGFYGGIWSPDGDAILAHAFGGSFHMWRNIEAHWKPQLVPSGHLSSVVDICWAKTGEFLLSASHDQTTRLFAPWDWSKLDATKETVSWHELARPQIHGHDLSCLAVLRGKGNHRYVSGAEEKVARVFEAPASFLQTLEYVRRSTVACGEMVRPEDVKVLGANLSALGLSQKPIYTAGDQMNRDVVVGVESMETVPDAVPAVLVEPPIEEHLGWNTLWPESHKLYGHGNEMFSMCSDHCGQLLATACKAQTDSVAEIWMWQIGSWKAAGRLRSHSLTVTQMEFSHNDKFLLSVSRDRHFSVFQASKTGVDEQCSFKLVCIREAHRRIIWTCSWSPCDRYFATGSRDKSIKLWVVEGEKDSLLVKQAGSLPMFKSSVTAVAWAPMKVSEGYLLAVGMEDGLIELWKTIPICRDANPSCLDSFESCCVLKFDAFSCHVASVNRLAWNEKADVDRDESGTVLHKMQLASCGADHTVRLFDIIST